MARSYDNTPCQQFEFARLMEWDYGHNQLLRNAIGTVGGQPAPHWLEIAVDYGHKPVTGSKQGSNL